jgi:ribosomal protein S18 acetylase RimI-like enzyme
MEISRAMYEDLDSILRIQYLAYESEAALYDVTIPPLTQTLDELKEDYNAQIFLKAVIEGGIVGSIRAQQLDSTCYISKMSVHPDFQNQGVGRALMSTIEEAYSDCMKYSLFTGHKSVKNLSYYTRMGYKSVSEKKINDALTLIFLEKNIR